MAQHPSRCPDLRADLPPVDIPLMQPAIEGDDENADGGIGVSHTMRPLVVHIDRPDNAPEGTLFELFWGPGSPVAYNIIRAGDEQLTRIPFTVPHDSIRESWADPVYVQVIRDQAPESRTRPLRLRVNLQHPGGQDNNPAPGNQNLVFELPEDVRLGGVDAQRAKAGVEVIIRYWQNMSAYDLLILVWGSVRVERLILPHEVGRDIVCTLDEDAIKEAGDSDLLPVAFQVRGATGNYPDPWALWSPIALVSVYLETNRLDAPWVQIPETEREIDLEELGSQHVQVGLTVSSADAKRYSHVFLYWNGTNAQGGSVSHFEDRELAGAKGYFFDIDNVLVRAIAQGSATVYYELTGADDMEDKRSHNRYLTVIGEVLEWPAPTVDQAQGGALDPALPLITIRFPAQASWKATDRLQVTVQSGDSGGTVDYIAGRTVGQVPPDGEMTFDLTHTELKRFDGRLIDVFYSVSRGSEKPQESLRQAYLVGEPVRDMPAPDVENAPGGQLDPDNATDGAKVTAPFAQTKVGDELTLYWYSLVSAPPIRIQIQAEGEVASFVVPYAYIEPNLDQWVSVFYSLARSGQPQRYSELTDLFIGRGLGELPVPDLIKASITGPANATLNPLNAQEGSGLVVSYTGMLNGDSIKLTMAGAGNGGSPDIPAKSGNEALQKVEFDIPRSAIAANIGNANKTFTLKYEVTRANVIRASQILTVTVTPIPQAELAKTVLKLNQANATTKVLELRSFTGNATAHMGIWPFITAPYPVWLKFFGKTDRGVDHIHVLFNGAAGATVNAGWISAGKYEWGLLRSYLDGLGHNTKLRMEFKAAFSLSKVEEEAITLPRVEYTVDNLPAQFPVPKLTQATGTGTSVTLAPLNAQAGATVSVEYSPMFTTDSIKVTMVGTAGLGSPAIAAKNGVVAGKVEFSIPASAIAANIGNANKTFTLKYEVTRASVVRASQILTVIVTPIPQAELAKTVLKLNQANAATKVLDLRSFTGNATAHIGIWWFITAPYPVWLKFFGKTDRGVDHVYVLFNGAAGATVNAGWISAGKYEAGLLRSYLDGLGHNTKLRMEFKAAFSLSKVEEEAIKFPAVEYAIYRIPASDPACTRVGVFKSVMPGKYYRCVFLDNRFIRTYYDCPIGQEFDEATGRCR